MLLWDQLSKPNAAKKRPVAHTFSIPWGFGEKPLAVCNDARLARAHEQLRKKHLEVSAEGLERPAFQSAVRCPAPLDPTPAPRGEACETRTRRDANPKPSTRALPQAMHSDGCACAVPTGARALLRRP